MARDRLHDKNPTTEPQQQQNPDYKYKREEQVTFYTTGFIVYGKGNKIYITNHTSTKFKLKKI